MRKKRKSKHSDSFNINIGTIIFSVIFVYVFIRIVISLPKDTLSIYEVQNSYIDTNISTTALIVREETLVTTDHSGYVSYYVRDGEKIGKNKTVYTIDETGSVYEKLKDADESSLAMSDESLTEVRTRISNFENYFNYSEFSDVYNFRYDIENAVLELTNEALIEKITALDSDEKTSTYKKVATNEAGIVTYYKDGYEDFDIKNFNAADVDKSQYKKETLKTGEIINEGEPVYKLVTSENWSLVAPISEKEAEELKDKDYIEINIHNSAKNIDCKFELVEKESKNFVIISLNQQMVNYINDRYIDIVIIMEQNNGLKIPNTSITTKKVCKIPINYMTSGSDTTSANYVDLKSLDEKGEVTIKQFNPTIYKMDEEYCYVNPDDFSQQDVITDTETNETLTIASAELVDLNGVYCVNQGVATFRYIEILFSDNEYTIIKSDVNYSIAWYDRIVLDHTMVEENQIIK